MYFLVHMDNRIVNLVERILLIQHRREDDKDTLQDVSKKTIAI